MMDKLALVAVGGGIGATLRFLGAGFAARVLGAGFWGTMAVNVVGSFAMGILVVVLLERAPTGMGRYAPFLITGVLGGFTTFSAFSLDAYYLIERGRISLAAFYIFGSLGLSILALAVGLLFARAMLS